MSVARAVNVSQNSSGWAVRSLELGREWNLTSKSKAASERIVGILDKGSGNDCFRRLSTSGAYPDRSCRRLVGSY
jgi:hypothetical protein